MKPKNRHHFSFTGRIRSFGYAFEGLWLMVKSQYNAWIHVVASISVIILGFYFSVTKIEWLFLILAIMAVWVAETLNTALEILCDVTAPGFHPIIKKAKDVAAGAVLISAVGALCIGGLIFIPYFLDLINNIR